MAADTLQIKITIAWWVRPYLQLVALYVFLTGRAPDLERVQRIVLRGVRTR
jgi:hypothetical protein